MIPRLVAQNPRAFSPRISATLMDAASPTRRKANQHKHMSATVGLSPGSPHPFLAASRDTLGNRLETRFPCRQHKHKGIRGIIQLIG